MADEIRVTSSMSARKGNSIDWREPRTTFLADMGGAKGPVPGAITVALAGTVIDLSQLTTPGICSVWNLEDSDTSANEYVEIGIKEPATGFFYPLLAFRPGQGINGLLLSPNLLEEYTGAGTGTSAATNQLFAKAIGAAAVLYFGAFEA